MAHEARKIYQKDLEPKGVPRSVPGTELTEEELLFLDTGFEEGEEEDGNEAPADSRSESK